jgi:beta-N-acetylhexosaminidase
LSLPDPKPPSAVIFGCAGTTLSAAERRLFAGAGPVGFILFSRNIKNPDQLIDLVGQLKESCGRPGALVAIDQEGGRVARLGPPHWRTPPAAARFGAIHALDPAAGLEAARLNSRLLADDLAALGINVDCLPVLDIPSADAHPIIGDRAYGRDPATVAALGRAAAEGLTAGGVLPVIKHLPGHGRARNDSHLSLPVVEAPRAVLEKTDFAPFRALADQPLGMTAHVVYSAIDDRRPATTSPIVIEQVVRGWIGFDGLLMSDDICMKALTGTPAENARAALAAGCDLVLHCNGDLDEMQAVADVVGGLSELARARLARARALLRVPAPLDRGGALARLERLMAAAAVS